MDAVRTIGECDAFQVQRAAQGGTSRVRWAIELAVAAVSARQPSRAGGFLSPRRAVDAPRAWVRG